MGKHGKSTIFTGGIATMRINIKRLKRTADKMHMSIAEEITADGGTRYAITGGLLGSQAEQCESAEELRDRLEHLHTQFIDGMNATAQPEEPTIIDPTIEPDYLKITDTAGRAELLGLKITADGGTRYTLEGDFLDTMNEGAQSFDSWDALSAGVNELWDIATEPEIICYIDNEGHYHERLTYPESLAN